jgi:hypothetical protein
MGSIWSILRRYGIIEGETILYGLEGERPPVDKGNDGVDILHTIGHYGWESLKATVRILHDGTIRQNKEYQ